MSHKIRLGPIAIFLVIVAVVLSTMVVLTTATTHADRVMAERYAAVTQQRYALNAQGERFLQAVDEMAAAGELSADALGAEESEAGITKEFKADGYTLAITVAPSDHAEGYTIEQWKLSKDWNAEDPYQNFWKGD